MNIGFGLGAFAVLTVFLNLIRIQLHWMVFLGLSFIIPIYSIYTHVSKHGLKIKIPKKLVLTKSTVYILIVLLLFIALFAVYHKGAFAYPYLEDDDPWLHAKVAKYVANYRTFSHDPSVKMNYMEPYPPAYATLMGVLHQTNTNIIWNLKFFNALLVALGVIFFYFFAKEFFDSRKKALFATFVITIIPCFLSHFIWASTLAIVLFFPAFYAAERIRVDKRWWMVAAVSIAGVLLSQPSNGGIFGMLFVMYWLAKVATGRSFNKHIFLAGVIGVALPFAFYYLPVFLKYGFVNAFNGMGLNTGAVLQQSHAHSGGGLIYSWNDFMFAKTSSKMDNPIGVGIVLFLLLVFSFVLVVYKLFSRLRHFFSKANFIYILMVLWLLFAFAGIHGNRLPIQLMPHRVWAIFAIPVALICVEGFFAIGKLSERMRIPRFFVYAILIIGIMITSGHAKYAVETSQWPPGVGWGSGDELMGYLSYLPQLPYNTKVFPVCAPEKHILSFDKWAEPWDRQYLDFKETAFDKSPAQLSSWLRSRGYEYIIIDSYCLKSHDANETTEKLQEIGEDPGFEVAGSTPGMFLFRVL
jgi:hypothetical protein